MYEWIVIGGGIHGVHLAARLLGEAKVPPSGLRIVDPAKQLLSRWNECTATTGMKYLRSPGVHHLGMKTLGLQHFAGKRKTRKPGLFAAPYERPSLTLFNSHCRHVIEIYGLADLHVQDRVIQCQVDCDSVSLGLASGERLQARQVILAVGTSDQPAWPKWAPRDDARIHHVFENGFDGWPTSKETICVLGGGISAAQISLRLVKDGHQVHLVTRHAEKEHQFDSDPGWLGPKLMNGFVKEMNPDRRRAIITSARHRGSLPPDVRRQLQRALMGEILQRHTDEVKSLDVEKDGLKIGFAAEKVLRVDRLLLATGFESHRPGGKMVDELVASCSLPCASCGYPIVDSSLRWHPRIYVAGPLAELEIGPVSRNIAGARRAADRLIDGLLSHQPGHMKMTSAQSPQPS